VHGQWEVVTDKCAGINITCLDVDDKYLVIGGNNAGDCQPPKNQLALLLMNDPKRVWLTDFGGFNTTYTSVIGSVCLHNSTIFVAGRFYPKGSSTAVNLAGINLLDGLPTITATCENGFNTLEATLINNVNYTWFYSPPGGSFQELPNHTPSFATTSYGSFYVVVNNQISGCINNGESNKIDVPQCFNDNIVMDGKYILSAWVKVQNTPTDVYRYTKQKVKINYIENNHVAQSIVIDPKGPMIDGWQKIEGEFTLSNSVNRIEIVLVNESNHVAFFDDVRVHPYNSKMQSFVYDPVNLRFVAQLDENNYATFYEYDEEGNLIRVKKETERGIMTVKESQKRIPLNLPVTPNPAGE